MWTNQTHSLYASFPGLQGSTKQEGAHKMINYLSWATDKNKINIIFPYFQSGIAIRNRLKL